VALFDLAPLADAVLVATTIAAVRAERRATAE
jgi:hypothetical protein